MLWIYGGSFVSGDGAAYEALNLVLEGNVIVVNFNYRLGPFGNDVVTQTNAFRLPYS
jgi:carboxylesterase type B